MQGFLLTIANVGIRQRCFGRCLSFVVFHTISNESSLIVTSITRRLGSALRELVL